MAAAMQLLERVQAEVDRRIQVAGRIAGVGLAGLVGVEDGNALAGLDQQHGGGQPCDAGADDGDVDFEVGLQGRQAGGLGRSAFPERRSIHEGAFFAKSIMCVAAGRECWPRSLR
jgi:hypothetical protein